jgi:hypothetical protein
MRTTLDIADDVLREVKDRARRQKRDAGDLLSELVREALSRRYGVADSETKEPERFYGFEPLPSRGRPVSNELIDKLREDDLG